MCNDAGKSMHDACAYHVAVHDTLVIYSQIAFKLAHGLFSSKCPAKINFPMCCDIFSCAYIFSIYFTLFLKGIPDNPHPTISRTIEYFFEFSVADNI